MLHWVILFLSNIVCLIAAVAIPRDELMLRTYATVIPATVGIAGYLYGKYRVHFGINTDVLTSIGVLAQFLLPSLYLVVVPLEGYFGYSLSGYLDYFPDVALAALIGQSLFFLGYKAAEWMQKRQSASETTNGIAFSTIARFMHVMFPGVCVVWVSRVILLRTGSYYHILHSQFMFESSFYSILAQISSYGTFVIAGLWVMVFSTRQPRQGRKWLTLAVGYTALELLWRFPSGSREPVLVLMAMVLFAYIFVRQLLPIKWIALWIVAGLFVLAFMDFYRYGIAQIADQTTGEGVIRSDAVVEAIKESKTKFLEEDYQTGEWLTRSMARLADARSVAAILQNVPSIVPYLGGETYARLPWVFVPRFLYPDKPAMILPIAAELVDDDPTNTTSSPTTLIGEAYLNFGWLGLFLVMPLVGWLSWQYDSAFRQRITHPIWATIYVGMALSVVRLPVQPVTVWLGVYIKAFLIAYLLVGWDKVLSRIRRS